METARYCKPWQQIGQRVGFGACWVQLVVNSGPLSLRRVADAKLAAKQKQLCAHMSHNSCVLLVMAVMGAWHLQLTCSSWHGHGAWSTGREHHGWC